MGNNHRNNYAFYQCLCLINDLQLCHLPCCSYLLSVSALSILEFVGDCLLNCQSTFLYGCPQTLIIEKQ